MSLDSAHPNGQVLRDVFSAFGRADRDATKGSTTDDFTWHPGNSPISGTREAWTAS